MSSLRPSNEMVDIMGRLEAYFQEVDLDGSGSIDFFEFMYLMYLMIQNGAYRDIIQNPTDAAAVKSCLMTLRQAYGKYDQGGKRRLERQEVHLFLTHTFGAIPPGTDDAFTRLQSSPARPHLDFCRFMRLLYEIILPTGKFVQFTAAPRPSKGDGASQRKIVQSSYMGTPSSKQRMRVDHLNPHEVHKDKLIGQGGFGSVFKATYRGHVVAAKFLIDTESAEALAETTKEVDLMARLDHPNIVYLVGSCINPPDVVIVTEFCDNGSLFDCIHKQRLQFDRPSLWRIAKETAVGVSMLHDLAPPIIHRDIKSLNILLDEHFTVKICDFGLSKTITGSTRVQTRGVGTPQWTAPEVLSSGHYSTPSDVYSYGVLLWEMWHRQVPYGNMDAPQIVLGVVTKKMRPPISRKCPETMAKFMVWCWDQEPQRRPTLRQVVAKLDEVQGEFAE
mmetsp:Transcript_65897/g.143848  ORF Transcript_65897/g.143848 Transcript_65897/m.143848 type:complete len:446 (+) Transcript_65897:1-1338(+)